MSTRVKSYLDFMDWLKDNHPDIVKHYHNNFTVPKKPGDVVSVNDKFNISKEEFDMLNKIAHSFYEHQ